MVKNAVGDEYDSLAEPPHLEAPREHRLWPLISKGLKDIYDPEIPVNIYELGLIYLVDISEDGTDGSGPCDIYVRMTLTSPGCPVAQEMPGWVQSELFAIEGVGQVEVEIVWDPTWDPSFMAETAKLQLNMFT
ncbi:MAG: DUF59 domain-containing protein [Rhodospirillales bacterium]|nr:DUF59 domain-containing protein [Rhodospirillales bacterium]